jgi:hypothetical protein
MPFDGRTDHQADPARPVLNLYRYRRERAAALWRGIPDESFDMVTYGCGSTCCALGWLAQRQFMGWHWQHADPGLRNPPAWPGWNQILDRPDYAAAVFFGLDIDDARDCFGGGNPTAWYHGELRIADVKPRHVAATLLRLPYHTRIMGHAV